MRKFPFFKQLDAMDCGPSCLRMILAWYGRFYTLQTLRDKCYLTREGVSLLGISEAAESLGMHTTGVRLTFGQLATDVPFPCIVHWQQKHFVVVRKVKKGVVYLADPACGLTRMTEAEFTKNWISTIVNNQEKGLALLLEPTPDFYQMEGEQANRNGFGFLFNYVKPYKSMIVQLVLGIFLTSFLQILFPFLFQALVDKGIVLRDMSFVNMVLVAWLVVVGSRMAIDFIRNWILLHLGTRINIYLISDFLVKMMRLPLKFFDSKFIGDLIQRIYDHNRIETFLTQTLLNLFFAIISLVVLGLVLFIFSPLIFVVFLLGSSLYLGWVALFMGRRRYLDNKRFNEMAHNQAKIIQLIEGMQEIKLNQCEKHKRWEWEGIQARLFRVNLKNLALSQYQQMGALVFNETKNILILFIAANQVMQGNLTIGAMMAVAFIIGQLNAPVDQLVQFFHSTQDARISLERLAEIHSKENEETGRHQRYDDLGESGTIKVEGLSFRYEGPQSPFVLEDVSLEIPQNKVTAIVGSSGSGKTTLIKLMLAFYEPVQGGIKVGPYDLRNVNPGAWRSQCGVVMQDGFIFSDSIARNIAVTDEFPDRERLLYAVQMANIREFIDSLPLGYNTKIGQEGIQLSQGQKQRVLIARAIYKEPRFIFLDEATNALDAGNELVILKNLQRFFENRTVVVVAHRLSTVKNADNIVVLEHGQIVESGRHGELVALKGVYFNLVKNQLELGM